MANSIRVMVERGKRKRTVGKWWTVQFVVRRSAWHMLDHAGEMEDRDLSACAPAG